MTVMKNDTTEAKIGWSMKKWVNFTARDPSGERLQLEGGTQLCAGRITPGCGVTLPPGRARSMPSITTLSVGSMPERITRSPSNSGPVCTTLGTTVPSALTVITTLRDWSVVTAASGSSREGCGADA